MYKKISELSGLSSFDEFQSQHVNLPWLNKLTINIQKLDQLNLILSDNLDPKFIPYCHVGAIDENKNQLIVYAENNHILHILENLSNHILRVMYEHNFSFDSILIKTKIQQYKNNTTIKYKNLSPEIKAKLKELSLRIGKPELVHTINNLENELPNICDEKKEIEL